MIYEINTAVWLNGLARAAGRRVILASVTDADRAFGQLAPAQAHTQPPQINLAEHRIRRKQVLGELTHEYQVAA